MGSSSQSPPQKPLYVVTSENLVINRKHREKWGAKIDSMREALIVVQQGIEKIEAGDSSDVIRVSDDVTRVGPSEDVLPDIGDNSRVEGKEANANTVQLTVKLFLRENDREIAKQAIQHVEKMLGTEHIHNVYVTVPASDVQFIGMSAHSEDEVTTGSENEAGSAAAETAGAEEILDPERERYAMDLAALWNDLSQIRSIESLGLCDVETDVFKRIYQQAVKKPKNVQVNLKSCCVVPPALKQFAAAKKIKLLTHSDSPEILGDSFCNQVSSFASSKDRKWKPVWIVRFQIFKELRGLLEDRRYIVALEPAGTD